MASHNTDSGQPHVHVLGTGGTIANITGNYVSESDFLPIDELLDSVPDEVTDGTTVTHTEITHVSSGALGPDIWFKLHDEIMTQATSDNPPDGFVVTHGSNTSEETAYFLNLALNTNRPVVVTAAQRNRTVLSSDGFRNLYDAIRVAGHPAAHGRGVMLVVNQEIHHAGDVTKIVSGRPDAWHSPNSGRIGDALIDVEFHHAPERPSTSDTQFDISGASVDEFPLTDIQIAYASFAADGTFVRRAMDDVAGIVVAGFPTNSVPSPVGQPQQQAALKDAAEQGIPVVICHRGLEGWRSVLDEFINGKSLRPQKARILLALGLVQTSDLTELQHMFNTY